MERDRTAACTPAVEVFLDGELLFDGVLAFPYPTIFGSTSIVDVDQKLADAEPRHPSLLHLAAPATRPLVVVLGGGGW